MSLFTGERGCHDWEGIQEKLLDSDDFLFLDLGSGHTALYFYNSLLN